MIFDKILETLKKLWEVWEIRGLIILSLSLQAILIFSAPMRKRIASNWLIMPLWTAYLLADWTANYAVGLISKTQSDILKGKSSEMSYSNNSDLLAFWAPFLLIHLGGPDTITAFSLEDNELWLRHLLALVFQALTALYIFFQTFPENKLGIPTLLMFISGITKYAERIRALHLASLNSFRDSMLEKPDPGPNYAKLMDEYFSKKEAKLPTRIAMIPEPDRGVKAMNRVKEGKLTDSEIELYAYKFYKRFKGLIVDLIFSFRERNRSRDFFLKRSAEDAFKLVEVELNLMYSALFTKFNIVYTGHGYLFRFISFASAVASLALFYAESKGDDFNPVDVTITYTLLWAAVALDIITFLMLISSYWFRVRIKKLPEVLDEKRTAETSTVNSETTTGQGQAKPLVKCFGQLTLIFTRRWSESISQFNLIYYCLHTRRPEKEKFIRYLGLDKLLDSLAYLKSTRFSEKLRDHIFEELKAKSELADDLDTAKEISSARGDWVLRVEQQTHLLTYILEVDYDQSLLLWHIATELCYMKEISEENPKDSIKHRVFSKLLSDYMIYLLVMQPTMMSAVTGIGQLRFRDTCAEAKKFLNKKETHKEPDFCRVIFYFVVSVFKYMLYFCSAITAFVILIFAFIVSLVFTFIITLGALIYVVVQRYCLGGNVEWNWVLEMIEKSYSDAVNFFKTRKQVDKEKHKLACLKILGVYTKVDPVSVKGDRSKSVLFDGCILAKQLQELGKNKWELMSKVWVELLSYAAIHCRANTHAQQLSRGGELITIVWLLAAHFGIGDQFQISEGHARAKLIVGK